MLFVGGGQNGVQNFLVWRRAGPAVENHAIFADHHHRAADRRQELSRIVRIWFERAELARYVEILIDQQIEWKVQRTPKPEMAAGVGIVDAEWFGVEFPESVYCLANRGQLVRSAAGEVLRIKEEQRPFLPSQVGQANGLARRAR